MRASCVHVGLVLVGWLAASAAAAPKFKPGDTAVVKAERAEIKQGSKVLATLRKGQRIKIHYVHQRGGFALVHFTLGGKDREGYIRLSDLEPPQRKGVKPKGSGFVPDDEVVVVAKQAKLMKGKEVLGRVPARTRLTVKKVRGDWLGVAPKIDGKTTFGWIRARDVDYAPVKDAEDDKQDTGDKSTKKK